MVNCELEAERARCDKITYPRIYAIFQSIYPIMEATKLNVDEGGNSSIV
jgi:hypothetical protein